MNSAVSDNFINTPSQDRQAYLSSLQRALKNGEFVPWYQPQYDYTSGKIVSAEALVRWKRGENDIVSPGAFIPVLEDSGLVSDLDRSIWEQVAKQQREWLDAGIPVLPVSVNISRMDLLQPDTIDFLCGLPERCRIPAELLRLEITESAYMNDSGLLFSSISALRSAGFVVEIDDFGSGYSSLNMLKDIEVDVLKLDMGFLSGSSSRGGAILSAILSMARNLELDVIAEGVETRPQADYLNSIGCAVMQGYLFYRPMPAEAYARELRVQGEDSGLSSRKAGRGVGDAIEFLDADTQATLLFNSFVGGAAIIEQFGERITFLRTNDRFFTELGTTRNEFQEKNYFSSENFSDDYRSGLLRALDAAYETDEEKTVELCATLAASDPVWTRNHIRFLSEKKGSRIFYMAIENITARRQLQERNRRLSAELSATVNSVPDGLARLRVADGRGTFEFVNDTLCRFLGFEPGELLPVIREDPFRFVHPDDRERVQRAFIFSFTSLSPVHVQCRMGRTRARCRDFDIRGDYGDTPGEHILYLSFTDVTDLTKAEASLRQTQAEFDSAIEQSGLMICRYIPEDRALMVSDETAKRFDSVTYMPDVRESMIRDGYIAPESAAAWGNMFDSLEKGQPGECASLCLKGLHGAWKWYSATWKPLVFEDKLESAVLCFRDITSEKSRSDLRHREEREIRQNLLQRAERDTLTGLYNRGTAEELINRHLASGSRASSLFILADMDDLKLLNDNYGHAAGDDALRKLASLFSSHFIRRQVVVARLGGDEFLIFIPDAGNATEQSSVLDSFYVKLSRLRVGPNGTSHLHCSLGCVLTAPGGKDDFAALYEKADKALYHVKRSLKNYFAFWSPSMEDDAGTPEQKEDEVIRQADMFAPENMNSLLALLSETYPMVLSLNFDRNQYYLLNSRAAFISRLPKFGKIRELLPLLNARNASGSEEEVSHFIISVRNAFSTGRTTLRSNTLQPDEKGNLRTIETTLFMYTDKSGALCAFALSREAG